MTDFKYRKIDLQLIARHAQIKRKNYELLWIHVSGVLAPVEFYL